MHAAATWSPRRNRNTIADCQLAIADFVLLELTKRVVVETSTNWQLAMSNWQ